MPILYYSIFATHFYSKFCFSRSTKTYCSAQARIIYYYKKIKKVKMHQILKYCTIIAATVHMANKHFSADLLTALLDLLLVATSLVHPCIQSLLTFHPAWSPTHLFPTLLPLSEVDKSKHHSVRAACKRTLK
jgi:hypothetical protein